MESTWSFDHCPITVENLSSYVDEQPHNDLQAQKLSLIETVISIVDSNIPNNPTNDKTCR